MADRHVIVGAGAVGTETARILAERGSEVVMVSRSGRKIDVAGVTAVAADASDPDQLAEAAAGATVLYNCANPSSYTTWAKVWPPLAASILSAAERTGAVLATSSSLYPYGPVDGPMVEDLPDAATDKKGRIRAGMWRDAHAAHTAGRVRAVEVRGSDYMGRGVGQNGHIPRVIPAALKGKDVRVLGRVDQPHSWTDVLDMARTLVAVAGSDATLGRVWHAPTNPPRTQEEAVNDVLRVVGKPPVKVRAYPALMVTALAPVVPLVRELRDMSYIVERPYVLDSSAAERELGLKPTPWDEVCARTADV